MLCQWRFQGRLDKYTIYPRNNLIGQMGIDYSKKSFQLLNREWWII